MKYVVFLRGINVGGKNLISMALLKKAFEDDGLVNVVTYINSGNVVFESDEKDTQKLTQRIGRFLKKTFEYTLPIVILSQNQLQDVLENVPNDWKTKKDIRCYILYLLPHIRAETAAKEVEPKEGVDFLKIGPGVLYSTTLLEGMMKSGLKKLITKPIYKELTIRNYSTSLKVMEIMER